MSLSVTYEAVASVRESATIAGLSANLAVLPYDAFNTRKSLDATTTPPATKQAQFNKALVAGAGTIDLTSLATDLGTVNFSGLKLQILRLKAPNTNTGKITVSKGASNGYGLDAAGITFSIPIAPGAELLMYFDDELPDVAGGAKTIDLAGTLTESLSVELVAG